MELLFSTGYSDADKIIEAIVSKFETAFTGQILGYYLIGSYADGSAVPLSDIDLCVLFDDAYFSAETKQQSKSIICPCHIRLDIGATSLSKIADLSPMLQIAIKDGSQLVFGQECRPLLKRPTLEAYQIAAIDSAKYFIGRIRHNSETFDSLKVPDKNDEFYGYTNKSIKAWYPEHITGGTKELVATVGRISTAILAKDADQYVPTKTAAFQLLPAHIGAEWGQFAADIYAFCKLKWQYLIPESNDDRRRLRSLCAKMVKFERLFLAGYC